jgi:hypothetical protein
MTDYKKEASEYAGEVVALIEDLFNADEDNIQDEHIDLYKKAIKFMRETSEIGYLQKYTGMSGILHKDEELPFEPVKCHHIFSTIK